VSDCTRIIQPFLILTALLPCLDVINTTLTRSDLLASTRQVLFILVPSIIPSSSINLAKLVGMPSPVLRLSFECIYPVAAGIRNTCS
jgi:hypothetical protein